MAQQTRTTTRQQNAPPPLQSEQSKGQVAVLAPPRLAPPPPALMQEYEVNEHGWRTLVEATFPAARTAHAVIMALDYCKRRKLDIFKHPMHIVPVYDSQKRQYVETIWPGINELRTTAQRTGQYAGLDKPEFGPMQTRTFKGRIKNGDQWEDREATIDYPEWCQITVYRLLNGVRVPFPGPEVPWLETYAKLNNFCEVPNAMWARRAKGQLEKCAEAAALRRAFPEEIGSDYTIDELGAFRDVTTEGMATLSPAEPEPRPEDFKDKGAGEQPKPTGQEATAKATSTGDAPSNVAHPEKPKDPPPKKEEPKKAATDVQDLNETTDQPGDPRDREEQEQTKPLPASTGNKGDLDENDDPGATPTEAEEPTPIKFSEFSKVGEFFTFADPWLMDGTRTEAEVVAFGAFYNNYMQRLTDEKIMPNKRVRDAMVDTKKLYQDALKGAVDRAKQPR